MLSWVVILSRHPARSAQHPHFCAFLLGPSLLSLVTKSPVVHPLSVQLLAKCSSRNSFVLKIIHLSWGGVPPNEEIMNSTIANSGSTIDIPAVTSRIDSSRPHAPKEGRCQHLFPNGKRCRKFASGSHLGLCLHHLTESAAIGAGLQQPPNDSLDLSGELLPQLSEFNSALDINQFLARLLTLVTKGRISPRRASVLAYITNQLLHSHRAITLETKPAKDEPQQWIFDLPRPERD